MPLSQLWFVLQNRIKELREARGMTLETLADLVGLSTSYVHRLENGDRNLAVKHFSVFAEALRVQPEDLIKRVGNRERALSEAILKSDASTQAVIARILGIDLDAIPPELPCGPQEKRSAKRK